MSDFNPQDHKNLFENIPIWVHSIWIALLALLLKGKSILKTTIGIASVASRVEKVEDQVLKITQTPRVSKNDIDVLRAELQGTLQSNQTNTISEIRFLFTNQDSRLENFKKELKDDIYKRYETLDNIAERLNKKVPQ